MNKTYLAMGLALVGTAIVSFTTGRITKKTELAEKALDSKPYTLGYKVGKDIGYAKGYDAAMEEFNEKLKGD